MTVLKGAKTEFAYQQGREDAVKWLIEHWWFDCDDCKYDKKCDGTNDECINFILTEMRKEKE